jgi:hypothetical protein
MSMTIEEYNELPRATISEEISEGFHVIQIKGDVKIYTLTKAEYLVILNRLS